MNKDIKIFNDPVHIFQNSNIDKESLYSDLPIPRVSHYKNWTPKLKNRNLIIGNDEQNSLNYRCDEFTNIHNEKHILFLGCSYTFGNGLAIDEIWSKKIYDRININNKCSGYFSLGYPGSSMQSQVVLAFKYFKNFGNPNVIFFNVPDVQRFFILNESKYTEAFYNLDTELLDLVCYQYYLMLDYYCLQNNIKLFSTSWAYAEKIIEKEIKNIESIESFKSFYKYNIDHLMSFVKNYDHEYSLMARDNMHLGVAYHEYWANLLYEKYADNIRN